MSRELPELEHDGSAWARRVADTVNAMLRGRSNSVGTVTLTAGATSTVVTDNRFQSQMTVILTPTTANAATAIATTYLSSRGVGTFTLTHANTADTDKTFLYARLG